MDKIFLDDLNSTQRQAVEYCGGAQLVIAGAGSGKTRVLTYKIAYLLSAGYEPWQILALTFTNKAAREMKERVAALVGGERARYLCMGTFHSVFARILRSEAQKIGYSPNFTIYDQGDSRSLVKAIIKEMGLDEKNYKPSAVADRISMAKNALLMPEAYMNSTESLRVDAERNMPMFKDVYLRYVQRCRQANAMDFDDLLANTYLLFARNDDTRHHYADRFRYVLVDEYQDTNHAQQTIILQLTAESQQLCVVGDDAQSIYSFRGANIDNILDFNKYYASAKLFKLEQNYRSTQLIVQAANSLITHNSRQIRKNVFSNNEHGEKLTYKPAYSDRDEALIVCNDIQRIKREDMCGYGDFAILYRTNSQSRSFEEYMRKMNIPYRIYGGLSFYQRKEIKDVIAYFRLVANPNDEEALKRIVNYPVRGIGGTTLGKIVAAAASAGESLWNVMANPAGFGIQFNKGTLSKICGFREMVGRWAASIATTDAYELGQAIIRESGVLRDIHSGSEPEDIARQENLEEFVGALQDFVDGRKEEDQADRISLPDFLQEVSLMTDVDSDSDNDSPKVSLMTIHSAKGLEFSTVFVVGVEENIFPSPMSLGSMRAIEEERRLFYVAITRAEKRCFITSAQNRFRFGKMEYDTPSRFISEINPELLKVVKAADGYTRDDTRSYAGEYGSRPEWMQNPRPVATQFKPDPVRRAVPPRREEKPESPFSDSFSRRIEAESTRRLRPLALASSPRAVAAQTPLQAGTPAVGSLIEHQRFGVGRVEKIEGSGENTKATVCFKNAGTKQLLLKFAKFKVL